MWTGTIKTKELNKGQLQIGVSYSNGVEDFTEVYIIHKLIDIENVIKNKLTFLEDMEVEFSKVQLDINYTSAPTNVSASQIEQQAYQNLLTKYYRVQEDVKSGLISASDPSVTKLTSDLKAAYKPEYSGL